MKLLILMSIFISSTTFAITLNKTLPLSEEAKVIASLEKCQTESKSIDKIVICSDKHLASSLTTHEKYQLLNWIALPFKLEALSKCDSEVISYLPAEMTLSGTQYLCSKFNKLKLEKGVVFLLKSENKILKVYNIKEFGI